MTYDTLLNGIAEKTGLQVEDIRSMMDALPDVLSEAVEGEQTRTPLGVFTMKTRITCSNISTETKNTVIKLSLIYPVLSSICLPRP